MIQDTHRLRRSILALLDNSPSKTLSYENITKMFPRQSSGELRTNIYALVRLGFAKRKEGSSQTPQDALFTVVNDPQEISPTKSALLYGKLEVSSTYSYQDIFDLGIDLGFNRGEAISALQSLVKDEALIKVSRGRYVCQDLPPIFSPRVAVLHPDQKIVSVCPLRRAIWDNLPQNITALDDVEDQVLALSPSFNKVRFTKALRAMESQGSLLVSEGLILKGDSYSPLSDDVVYAHIKDLDEVTYEEIKSISIDNQPQNVIMTLRRRGALERITTGRYKVLPLPQYSTEEEVEECLSEEVAQEQTQDEVTVTTEWAVEVAEALANVDNAKSIYESLRGEAALKKEQVIQLRSKAEAFSRRADALEASYKQPLAIAEQKAMEARTSLSNILKQNGLI